MGKLKESPSNEAVGAEEIADSQMEVSQKTVLQKLLLFLLRLSGTLAAFLFLAIAAWLHVIIKHPTAELFSIVFAELGAVLLSISILHFAYELFLRRQYEHEMRLAFKRAVRRELRKPENLRAIVEATREDNERCSSFLDHGVEEILDFSFDKLSKELKGAKYIRILKTWFPENNQLQTAFEEALENRNTRIELLLCDPDYELLHVRSRGASVKSEEARRRVIDALDSIRKVRCREPDPIGCFDQQDKYCNTRVGLYKAWPGCPVIWCDDRIFLGFYFFGRSSLRSPWIRVKPDSQLAEVLDKQFTLLWKDDRTQEFGSEALGNWLAPLTKPRKERKGWWKKRKSKKVKQETSASEAPPEISSDR